MTTTRRVGRWCAAIAGWLALASPALAAAEPAAAAAPEQAAAADAKPEVPYYSLSGDWGGRRSAWRERGLAIEFGYKADILSNRSGGAGRGTRTMWQLDARIAADFGSLWGWDGASGYLQVINDRGGRINDPVGSLMGASNIEVPVATTRLFHAWLQQNFLDDSFSLLAGLYPIDSEFSVLDSASIFLHPAYGTPADMALTRGPSIFNNSAFGLRLKWSSPQRTFYAQGAVLDGIPNDPSRPKRTTVRLGKGDGSFGIAEIGWTPLEQGHFFEPATSAGIQAPEVKAHEKYEGTSKLAIGAWAYSSRVKDQFEVDASGNPLDQHSQGGYVLAERTLFRIGGDRSRDLTLFARYTASSGHDTAIDRMLNLGVRVRGPLASRPDDVAGIAWTRGRMARGFRAAQAAAGFDTTAAEDAIELTWRAAATKWLYLQPNLQYIRHPGGDAGLAPARLIGLRIEAVL